MEPGIFRGLVAQLDKVPFTKDKISVLNSYKYCTYSVAEAATILAKFTFSSDKEAALETIAPQLTTLSGQDAKQLITGISFGKDQVKAVKHIACRIDPATKYAVLDGVTFHSDQSKAREYLDAAVFVPGGSGASPQPGPHPGAYPPQQPGGYQPARQPGGYQPRQPGGQQADCCVII